MTVSSPACTVFINGSYTGNCPTNPTLARFFAQSPIVTDLFYALVVMAVVFGALFLITKYRERGLGRFLEGFTGLIGVARFAAAPNQVGKITTLTEKIGFFDAGKGKMRAPILLMPDSKFQLGAGYGGMAFAFVDGDKRSSVAPDALERRRGHGPRHELHAVHDVARPAVPGGDAVATLALGVGPQRCR